MSHTQHCEPLPSKGGQADGPTGGCSLSTSPAFSGQHGCLNRTLRTRAPPPRMREENWRRMRLLGLGGRPVLTRQKMLHNWRLSASHRDRSRGQWSTRRASVDRRGTEHPGPPVAPQREDAHSHFSRRQGRSAALGFCL